MTQKYFVMLQMKTTFNGRRPQNIKKRNISANTYWNQLIFKLKFIWPNYIVLIFQIKKTSDGRRPQNIKSGIYQHPWFLLDNYWLSAKYWYLYQGPMYGCKYTCKNVALRLGIYWSVVPPRSNCTNPVTLKQTLTDSYPLRPTWSKTYFVLYI